jgi:hypothetical protein
MKWRIKTFEDCTARRMNCTGLLTTLELVITSFRVRCSTHKVQQPDPLTGNV